jgi:hypothetical protein
MEQKTLQHFNEIEAKAEENKNSNTFFWSRIPGKFVNKMTGEEPKPATTKRRELVPVSETSLQTEPRTVIRILQEREVDVPVQGPQFVGNVKEWYETLVETIISGANTLFKRHLQAPGVLEVGPDVLTILEHCVGYKANYKTDEKGDFVEPTEVLPMTRGVWVGTLNNRFKVAKVEAMPSNEAHVVLITEVKVIKKDAKPDGEVFPEGHPLAGAPTPKLPEIDIEKLPSVQRLDQWDIKILDMNIL